MKLATCLVAAVLTMASLSACGDDGGDDDAGTGADPTSEESSETPDETADDATEEPTEEPSDDSGGGGDYCDALQAAKENLETFGDQDTDIGQFEQVVSELRELADEAPSDVADDWAVLISGFDTLQQALADAGLSMGDLADPQSMQDLDRNALRELTQKLEALDSKQFEQAGTNIEGHAKAECGFELDAS